MNINKNKGGRPLLVEGQKKSYVVKISLDKGQYNLVEYKAKKSGIESGRVLPGGFAGDQDHTGS